MQTNAAKLWVIDVNDSVTHGPMPYLEAVMAQEQIVVVPGVVDTVLRPADDEMG